MTLQLVLLNDIGNLMFFVDGAKLFVTKSVDLQTFLQSTNIRLQLKQLKLGTDKSVHQSTYFYLDINKIPWCQIIKLLRTLKTLKWIHHTNYLFRIILLTLHQILESFKTRNVWTLLKLYTILN